MNRMIFLTGTSENKIKIAGIIKDVDKKSNWIVKDVIKKRPKQNINLIVLNDNNNSFKTFSGKVVAINILDNKDHTRDYTCNCLETIDMSKSERELTRNIAQLLLKAGII